MKLRTTEIVYTSETRSNTLCESGRRCQLQYRLVNPLESELNKFPKSICTLKASFWEN